MFAQGENTMLAWFLFGAMCMLVVLFLWAYFELSSLNKAARLAWNRLDDKMKHRLELLPNLVLYASSLPEMNREQLQSQQKEILAPAPSVQQRVEREGLATQFFKQIISTAQQRPEAEKDTNFTHLRDSLIEAENSVQRAKRNYNSAAHKFNMVSTIVPINFVSSIFEMPPYEYFDFDRSIEVKK